MVTTISGRGQLKKGIDGIFSYLWASLLCISILFPKNDSDANGRGITCGTLKENSVNFFKIFYS